MKPDDQTKFGNDSLLTVADYLVFNGEITNEMLMNATCDSDSNLPLSAVDLKPSKETSRRARSMAARRTLGVTGQEEARQQSQRLFRMEESRSLMLCRQLWNSIRQQPSGEEVAINIIKRGVQIHHAQLAESCPLTSSTTRLFGSRY